MRRGATHTSITAIPAKSENVLRIAKVGCSGGRGSQWGGAAHSVRVRVLAGTARFRPDAGDTRLVYHPRAAGRGTRELFGKHASRDASTDRSQVKFGQSACCQIQVMGDTGDLYSPYFRIFCAMANRRQHGRNIRPAPKRRTRDRARSAMGRTGGLRCRPCAPPGTTVLASRQSTSFR